MQYYLFEFDDFYMEIWEESLLFKMGNFGWRKWILTFESLLRDASRCSILFCVFLIKFHPKRRRTKERKIAKCINFPFFNCKKVESSKNQPNLWIDRTFDICTFWVPVKEIEKELENEQTERIFLNLSLRSWIYITTVIFTRFLLQKNHPRTIKVGHSSYS